MEKNSSHLISGFIFVVTAFIALLVLAWTLRVYGLAGVSVGDFLLQETIVANPEIKWTQEMEKKRQSDLKALQAQEKKKVENVKQTIEKPQQVVKEVKPIATFDIDKLAYAVAMAETGNCTKGYGKTYNNCFGIKNGNTAPCPKIGKSKMCIYEKPEDSYVAFKIIWSKWYKTFPTHRQAVIWTGADSANNWRKHVTHFYYQ